MNASLALRMALHSIHILPNAYELDIKEYLDANNKNTFDWVKHKNLLARLSLVTDDPIPQVCEIYRIDYDTFILVNQNNMQKIGNKEINSFISMIYPRITHLFLDTKAGDIPVVIFCKKT